MSGVGCLWPHGNPQSMIRVRQSPNHRSINAALTFWEHTHTHHPDSTCGRRVYRCAPQVFSCVCLEVHFPAS